MQDEKMWVYVDGRHFCHQSAIDTLMNMGWEPKQAYPVATLDNGGPRVHLATHNQQEMIHRHLGHDGHASSCRVCAKYIEVYGFEMDVREAAQQLAQEALHENS